MVFDDEHVDWNDGAADWCYRDWMKELITRDMDDPRGDAGRGGACQYGVRAKAWCLLIHAEASRSLQVGTSEIRVEPAPGVSA